MKTIKDRGLLCLNFEELVMQESERQVEKWGIQDCLPAEWLMFLTEEIGELAEAIQSEDVGIKKKEDVISEAVQVATLALKIAEMYKVEKENEEF